MNVDILGISKLRWIGMGEFNSDDIMVHCGQEYLRRNGVAIMVNKRVQNAVLGCSLKNDRMISVCFQGKPSEVRQNENHSHRKLAKLITWITALSNSMKL